MSFPSWLRSLASACPSRTTFSRSRNPRHSRRRATGVRLELLEVRALLTQFLVTSVLDDSGAGTLRDAITQANATADADVIQFGPGVSGTITLTSGQLRIDEALTKFIFGAIQTIKSHIRGHPNK